MVFGKQSSAESLDKPNNSTARSNDKKSDDTSSNQDTTSTVISKLYPIQPDNMPTNLMSRFDATTSNPLTTINRTHALVRL